MIGGLEIAKLCNPSFDQVDRIQIIIAQVAVLSATSNNHLYQLICYLFCTVYYSVRTYYWINSNTYRYVKFNVYTILSMMLIYFCSRAFNQIQRERFLQAQKQSELLKLFNNLVKAYHDGLIISNSEGIVFYNDQVSQMLNL